MSGKPDKSSDRMLFSFYKKLPGDMQYYIFEMIMKLWALNENREEESKPQISKEPVNNVYFMAKVRKQNK